MKNILLILLLLPLFSSTYAQNNILLLRKKNKTIQNFYEGKFISLQTVDKSYADGIITRIINDSIFIQHFDIEKSVSNYGGVYFDTAFRYTTAIHYKEIGAILNLNPASNKKRNGTILMIAGAGVLALGAVNGLYRGDPPKDWYKPSGFVVAGALTALGIWMRTSADKKYFIGKKYHLKILSMNTR